MQSDYHNLPTVNGVMQKDGREFRARDVQFAAGKDDVTFSLDIAAAYPQEAKVAAWRRSLTLYRPSSGENAVQLTESYELSEFVTPFRLNLLTPLLVDVSGSGRIVLSDPEGGKRYFISYDPGLFSAAAEEIRLDDARLQASWGARLARIVLTSKARAKEGSYKIRVEAANGTQVRAAREAILRFLRFCAASGCCAAGSRRICTTRLRFVPADRTGGEGSASADSSGGGKVGTQVRAAREAYFALLRSKRMLCGRQSADLHHPAAVCSCRSNGW